MRRQVWPWTLALLLASSLAGCAASGWRQQLQSEDPLKRIDGAVTAGRTREKTAVAQLIDRLEDDDEAVRMYAILALQRIEGTTLGYKYWAEPTDLAHMTQRWRDYIKDRHAAQTAGPLTPTRQYAADNQRQAAPEISDPLMERTPSTQLSAQEAIR